MVQRFGFDPRGYEDSLGTVGGGNHFVELQVLHHAADPEACAQLGISKKNALVLVHSGSRGLGQAVLYDYYRTAGGPGNCVAADSAEGRAYLAGHDNACSFAKANRAVIAERFAQGLGGEVTPLLDIAHNLVEQQTIGDGRHVFVHRKGAAPSNQGLVVIPGSRGSYSYIVRPIGDGSHNLFSLAHGAGRQVPRGQCREMLRGKDHRAVDMHRIHDKDKGIKSMLVCGDRDLLYEEHPQSLQEHSKSDRRHGQTRSDRNRRDYETGAHLQEFQRRERRLVFRSEH